MEIRKTSIYELFKFKKENREINYNKVMTLKSKILEDGRQIMPIICNENMEILDGQHRFAALKELDWPIIYYIDKNITSADLISINNTQTNWGLIDYIHYYANLGNETYIKIEEMIKQYKHFPIKTILAAISEKYIKERNIKSGELDFTDEDFAKGEETLEYINDIVKNIKMKINTKSVFLFLLVKTYYLEDIDRDKLRRNVISRYGTENYGNSLQCAMALEHWYNFRQKSTYRYISNEIIPKR